MLQVNEDATVGIEAFSRIAPSVPTIANVVISDNLFEVLTASTGGRLQFSVYQKYLGGLERLLLSITPSILFNFFSFWYRKRGIRKRGNTTIVPFSCNT